MLLAHEGTLNHPVLFLLAVFLAGFSVGLGLVLGAFVARMLRRYMRDEGLNGRS